MRGLQPLRHFCLTTAAGFVSPRASSPSAQRPWRSGQEWHTPPVLQWQSCAKLSGQTAVSQPTPVDALKRSACARGHRSVRVAAIREYRVPIPGCLRAASKQRHVSQGGGTGSGVNGSHRRLSAEQSPRADQQGAHDAIPEASPSLLNHMLARNGCTPGQPWRRRGELRDALQRFRPWGLHPFRQ